MKVWTWCYDPMGPYVTIYCNGVDITSILIDEETMPREDAERYARVITESCNQCGMIQPCE